MMVVLRWMELCLGLVVLRVMMIFWEGSVVRRRLV